jgi:O-antigen ligase
VLGQVLAIPISFGPVSSVVTLTQIVILFSIFWFLSPRVKPVQSPLFSGLSVALLAHLFVCGISYFITLGAVSELISMAANIGWFLVVGATLRTGVSLPEWRRLCSGILAISLIPIGCGLIELVTGRPLFTHGLMGNGLSESVFYVRGTHTDKLDFSFEMALCIFIGVAGLLSRDRSLNRRFLWGTTGLAALLIAFSWSTTGLIGVAVGLVLITVFLRSSGQMLGAITLVGLLGLAVYAFFASTSIGEGQKEAYELKVNLETGTRDSGVASSFRVLSIEACISGAVKNPFTGIGFGNQFEYIQIATGTQKPMNAHTALSVFLELGFVGGLPFAILVLITVRSALRTARSIVPDDAVAQELGLIAIAFTGYTIVRYVFYFHYLNSSQDFIWMTLVLMASGQYKGAAQRRFVQRMRDH